MITKGNFGESGAIFSDDMKYRYRLWRCWNHDLPRCVCIMLNPSTADEVNNDPTIERRIRHIQHWQERGYRKFGSIEIVNAFALRSTDPSALLRSSNPVGPDNDASIRAAVHSAMEFGRGLVICGWGKHGLIRDRHDAVLDLLRWGGYGEFSALTLNKDGTPGHPLYISYDTLPRRWREDGYLGDIVV